MRGFKAKAVIVRELNGIKIIFYDRQRIYVQNLKDGRWHLFHRINAPIGSYNRGWRQFRHLMLYNKRINLLHCYRVAFRWGITSCTTTTEPDLSKFKIEERI